MGCNDHIWKLELEPPQKLILLALLENPDDEGKAAVSLDYVAWKTGYTRTHAIRVVNKMADDGLLVITKRPGRTSQYQLNLEVIKTQEAYLPGISRRSQDVTGRKMSPVSASQDATASGRKMSPNYYNYINSVPGFEAAHQTAIKYGIKGFTDSALAAAIEAHGGVVLEKAMQIAAMKDKPDWLYVVGIADKFEERVQRGTSKVTYQGWTPAFVDASAEQNLRIVEELMASQENANVS